VRSRHGNSGCNAGFLPGIQAGALAFVPNVTALRLVLRHYSVVTTVKRSLVLTASAIVVMRNPARCSSKTKAATSWLS